MRWWELDQPSFYIGIMRHHAENKKIKKAVLGLLVSRDIVNWKNVNFYLVRSLLVKILISWSHKPFQLISKKIHIYIYNIFIYTIYKWYINFKSIKYKIIKYNYKYYVYVSLENCFDSFQYCHTWENTA